MNPYGDLTDSAPYDVTPPPLPTVVQIDQSVQWELYNPYTDVVFASFSAHDENQSDASNPHGQSDASNPHGQSDASSPHGLAIISAQFEAEFMSPDLECSVCFSLFNNAFRCPKKLQCGHTFCLECLTRINVKSLEPSAVQCPLCRAVTALPALGPPKLSTDPHVLSRLPSSMHRVYSVRFLRNKGRLQLKRPDAVITRTQSTRRSLDVGFPSPIPGAWGESRRGGGGAWSRLADRPACRAVLLVAVVMTIVGLTAAIVFLLTKSSSP